MKKNTITLDSCPLPDTLPTEMQVIADIISSPETLMEAERTLSVYRPRIWPK